MQVPELPETGAFRLGRAPAAETAHERVYRHISYMLMAGFFQPGETISLRQLSSALHVSEMPVRNALNRLIAESAIELLPNRQTRIPTLDRGQFDELTRVRLMLETDIAADAYRRATRGDIDELEAINAKLVEAIGRGETQKSIDCNQRFHLSFYAIAGRPLTFSLITNVWLRAGAFMHAVLRSDLITWRASYHDALIRALRLKNLDACVQAIRDDIIETHKEIVGLPAGVIFPAEA
ncbi:MAG: hypothetical protein DCC69_04435 [Hyphomicrobiales bacterium]|nr:MAG: hypothetical protein DCC69_04435 [Hyphomicrobiales bacterium]